MEVKALVMKPDDNVATAITDISKGDSVELKIGDEMRSCRVIEEIPFGFKFSLGEINKGTLILKYGQPIGRASQDIPSGTVVHIHNVEGIRGRGDI